MILPLHLCAPKPYQKFILMRAERIARIRQFLSTSLWLSLCFSLPVYAWARLIFFEVPLSFSEDIPHLLRMSLTGWMLMSAFMGCYEAAKWVTINQRLPRLPQIPFRRMAIWRPALLLIVLCSLLLFACNGQVVTGVNKDLGTGLTTSYTGIKPARSMLVMNDEVLNHNDIPIGESFQLINDQVDGLVEKDGKVSVGCSLRITDKNGKVIMDQPDLFKSKDVFEKKDARMLRCTISTGEPMEWEELYDVKVVFWDKFGTGKIENTVTIRMIDIP